MNVKPGYYFMLTAFAMLLVGLVFGILASLTYIFPDFLKSTLGFIALRPLHVSSILFWILSAASACIYFALHEKNVATQHPLLSRGHFILWLISIAGTFYAYLNARFGGREYWEFDPVWALPLLFSWLLFVANVWPAFRKIKEWPVYVWMWFTGTLFFLFTFLENYLWLIPFFREHFVTDMTIQWKVNGSLVGAWNQMIYGTAFYLMDKISKTESTGKSKLAFIMYFLGLTNLMFNWGHHIYTLPTAPYVRIVAYAVSMTEWIFLIKIFYNWKRSIENIKQYYQYFPFRFLIASDFWVMLNLFQAILMSVPAINKYTHGTHITVAHAMGTTIGINTMILMASACMFMNVAFKNNERIYKWMNASFWMLQVALFFFWASLLSAGVYKAIWQFSEAKSSYAQLMQDSKPFFVVFIVSGTFIFIALLSIIFSIVRQGKYKQLEN